MSQRKVARKATTTIANIQNLEMVSALSKASLSPLPSSPSSLRTSAVSGEKRSNHDNGYKEVKTEKRAASSGQASPQQPEGGNCGWERLQRHRNQVAGSVWIPDMWGKEEFLKEWTDCVSFDRSLVPAGLVSAKAALIEEYRRSAAGPEGVRINLGAN